MSQDLKVKFLQFLLHHWSQRSSLRDQVPESEAGFTLMELLIVIIIVGILAVIALPSFLNQANKARESEAKQHVSSMNRSQQAFYLERRRFSTDFSDLGLGIQTQTANYQYRITNLNANQPDQADPSYRQAIVSWSQPINPESVRSYLGIVDVIKSGQEFTTLAILCGRKTAGTATVAAYSVDASTSSTTLPACQDPFYSID